MTDVIIVVLILLPLSLTYFLKANAALAYLAVCAGYTVQNLAGSDIGNFLAKPNLGAPSNADITLLLLLVPMLLTLFSSTRSWSGQAKMVLQLLAALATGLLLTIIAIPFIGAIVDVSISTSKIWPLTQHIRGTFIIGATLYCLVLLWLGKTHHVSSKHKK